MGGERMVGAGLERVVRSEDMAVMGITEVIRHLPRIYREFRRLKQAIRARRPDVAVLIDFPDIHSSWPRSFTGWACCRLLRQPAALGMEEAPHPAGAEYVTRMLVIFPFEEPFYRERGCRRSLSDIR